MESDLIAWIRRHVPAHPALRLGIGDDAAVVMVGEEPCVVTTDVLMDTVDFELHQIDPRRAGRKALAANLSDLAAMAAQPLAAVVGVVLPRRGGGELGRALFEGMLPLVERYQVALAGGDTNSWDGPLVISITLLGRPHPRGVWRRAGAQPGDALLVTGELGGSILGRHLDFEPRVDEALLLADRYQVHAAIDISDGLSLDLSRLAAESGLGAVIEVSAIPIAEDAQRLAASRANGSTALDHALSDGEDFELLLAAPPDEAARIVADQPLSVPITRIGTLMAEAGLWRIDPDGARRPLEPRGYEHRL